VSTSRAVLSPNTSRVLLLRSGGVWRFLGLCTSGPYRGQTRRSLYSTGTGDRRIRRALRPGRFIVTRARKREILRPPVLLLCTVGIDLFSFNRWPDNNAFSAQLSEKRVLRARRPDRYPFEGGNARIAIICLSLGELREFRNDTRGKYWTGNKTFGRRNNYVFARARQLSGNGPRSWWIRPRLVLRGNAFVRSITVTESALKDVLVRAKRNFETVREYSSSIRRRITFFFPHPRYEIWSGIRFVYLHIYRLRCKDN